MLLRGEPLPGGLSDRDQIALSGASMGAIEKGQFVHSGSGE